MEFNEIIDRLTMGIPYYFSKTFASQIATKLIEKPVLFHDWELDRNINNKLVTWKFTISMCKVTFVECPGISLFVQNKTTGEAWIV
jgi:hypothetical protein